MGVGIVLVITFSLGLGSFFLWLVCCDNYSDVPVILPLSTTGLTIFLAAWMLLGYCCLEVERTIAYDIHIAFNNGRAIQYIVTEKGEIKQLDALIQMNGVVLNNSKIENKQYQTRKFGLEYPREQTFELIESKEPLVLPPMIWPGPELIPLPKKEKVT